MNTEGCGVWLLMAVIYAVLFGAVGLAITRNDVIAGGAFGCGLAGAWLAYGFCNIARGTCEEE